MQRWTAALLALLVGAAMALVISGTRPHPPAPGAVADAGLDAAVADAAATLVPDGGEPTDGGDPDESASTGTGAEAAQAVSDAGARLITGEAAPSVPSDAPKSVTFGVILVQYRGAQGALPSARTKEDALELAKQLAEEARKDFKATVSKGDKGSMDNAGKIGRGFLEPAPEYVLFTLPKDGVSDPVDTPRGFWIIHRIE